MSGGMAMSNYRAYKEKALQNPEVKTEYDALQAEYDIIQSLIDARANQNITQKELSLKTGIPQADIIDGPYWAKMFVLCFYTIWIVMPFKILILTSALASVNPMYYNAARVDGTSRFRMFTKITLPMISPMVFYLIITGFIGRIQSLQ